MHASSFSSDAMQRRGWYAFDMYPRTLCLDRGTVDVRVVALLAKVDNQLNSVTVSTGEAAKGFRGRSHQWPKLHATETQTFRAFTLCCQQLSRLLRPHGTAKSRDLAVDKAMSEIRDAPAPPDAAEDPEYARKRKTAT